MLFVFVLKHSLDVKQSFTYLFINVFTYLQLAYLPPVALKSYDREHLTKIKLLFTILETVRVASHL